MIANSTAGNKTAIRRRIRLEIDSMTPAFALAASRTIQESVLALPQYRSATAVGCYLSTATEPRTDRILIESWKTGKRVAVPEWDSTAGTYFLTWLQSHTSLATGPSGILQPSVVSAVTPGDIDMITVPGLAFDGHGNRLGHGKGHYDRMLSDTGWLGVYKLGLAFDFQVVDAVPAIKTDVRMDAVLTERRIVRSVDA